jgi:hypothetical protein
MRTAVSTMALALALCVGCAGSGGGNGGGGGGGGGCKPPETPTVTLSGNVQPIFNRSCAVNGCHVGAVPASELNLSAGQTFAQTVDVPSTQSNLDLVTPGKPDQSYLVRKIEGGPNIFGTIMPQGCPGAPLNGAQCLSSDDTAAIRQWITECAQNN